MSSTDTDIANTDIADTEQDLEAHRRELTGYCYRMLGSAFEADDAVQETMLRAWRGSEGFEGRSSLRSWLYRIATNVCLDMLRGEKRRALPMDLGPSSPPVESLLRPWPAEDLWVTPVPTATVAPEHGDPAEIAAVRESVRLAFVTALQHLPPRQRAALILCEVLRTPAAEAAAILDSTVASVNSALQRARATLASLPDRQAAAGSGPGLDTASADLLARYVDAFERYDMTALLALIHEDAVMTMPPFEMWLRGGRDITAWMVEPGPSACAGSVLVPVEANGVTAWGQYKPDRDSGGYMPWALQVHEVRGEKLSAMTFFLDVQRLFPLFGLSLSGPTLVRPTLGGPTPPGPPAGR
jgi:RNA polymerase sigma-70 factor (ECF subfamily)